MKRFLHLLPLLLAVVTATAAPRTLEQARAAARQLWQSRAAKHAPGHKATVEPQLVFTAERTATRSALAAPYYYVFTPTAGADGYAIVSGDDRLPAIVGYTAQGEYAEQALPEALRGFLAEYRAFLDQATDEQIAEAAAFHAQQKHAAVEPFIKTQWNQESPYNNRCPNSNGQRCITGCVATAVSQVLYYYKTPAQLLATIPSYVTKTKSLRQQAINAGEKYDWANMLPVYTGSESAAEKDAVAKLMYHVGCSMQMDYTPSSSGAVISAEALVKYFGMDSETTRCLQRSSYDIASWDAALYAEMSSQRPVLYSGKSSGGGHAFVVDGYDDGLYHVNWGWGGQSDGLFDITVLNPRNNAGAGATSTPDGYSLSNDMFIGLQPDNGKVDVVPTTLLRCKGFSTSQLSNLTVSGGTVTATVSDVYLLNFSPSAFTRYLNIGYRAADGIIVPVATTASVQFPTVLSDGRAYAQTYSPKSIAFAAENGRTYTLQVIESADGKTWEVCQQYNDNVNAAVLRVEGGNVATATPATLTAAVALSAASKGFSGMSNTIDITFANTGNTEYYGRVYVMVSKSETRPSGYTYSQGITATPGEAMVMSFPYTPATSGTYHFWVLDAALNELGTGDITFQATATPNLALVSIRCVNASGRKGYHKYSGWNIEMDEIDDVTAVFEYEIRNAGGYYEGDFPIFEYKGGGSATHVGDKHIALETDATTTVTLTITGKAGDLVGVWLGTYTNSPKITPLAAPACHFAEDRLNYLTFSTWEPVYLAGIPSAIAAPQASQPTGTACYNLNGQRVSASQRGIVIENGRKVVRR